MATICEGLDRGEVSATIAAVFGNLSVAAKRLGVTLADLRRLVAAEPEVMDAALDEQEARLDRAEAAIRRAMRKGRLEDRLHAAAFVFRLSQRDPIGHRRAKNAR